MDKKRITNFMANNAIIVLLAVLVIYVGITQQGFVSWRTFSNIVSNVSPRFIIALGISGALITKGVDLSAGRLVGLGGVIGATLLQDPGYNYLFFDNNPVMQHIPVIVVLLIVILVTGLFGLLNGIVITKFHVPPFLTTLGMQTIVYGLNLVYCQAEPIGGLQEGFTNVSTGEIVKIKFAGGDMFTLKYLLIYAIIAGLIFWFLYNKTTHGKYMYAIGGNTEAAEVSGINTGLVLIKIYALAGAMYGIAGFLLTARAGGASVNLGLGYELEAIAACTIGGVSQSGGVGKVSGVLIGVCVFELLKVSLQFLGVNPSYQFIAQGVVIIVAVALDIRKYIRAK